LATDLDAGALDSKKVTRAAILGKRRHCSVNNYKIILQKKPMTFAAEKIIHETAVPVGLLLNVAEAAEHPKTKARNMLIEAGGVRMTGNPVKIRCYDDPGVRAGAPILDQHGSALRREFTSPRTEDADSVA
jgi:crotonobetainyl-CoA:carnitine CoA-transferase CaiB-like acyl-CoA transferase